MKGGIYLFMKTLFLIVSILFSLFVAFNLYVNWMHHIWETVGFICILISQFFVIRVLLSDVLRKEKKNV